MPSAVVGSLRVILGLDAAQFEAGTQRVTKTVKQAESSLRQLGAALGAAFSVQQFSMMASQATSAASAIQDLAAKMGIGAAAVQELGYAAKQNGATIEDVGRSLALMGDRLVEGNTGTVAAINRLGLSLESLRAMKPDEAFTAIATAISTIPDPMERSKVAMDLFGRSGADLLPVLTSNISGLRQEAREMGAVMSDELIAKGDALDDSWAAMQQRVLAVKTEAMVPLLQTFLELPKPIQSVMGIASEFSGVLSGLALAVMAVGGPVAAITAIGTALTTVGTTITGFVAAIGAVPLAIGGAAATIVIYREDILRDLAGLKFLPQLFADMAAAVVKFALMIGNGVKDMAVASIGWAQKLYEGVKAWMVDKLGAVMRSVKAPIDAVAGFFEDLYDKVVGHSFVPDLVAGIEAEFSRLGAVMVNPAASATGAVTGSFRDMFSGISDQFASWGKQAGQLFSTHIAGPIGKGMGDLASGLVSGLSSILTGGLAGVFAMALPIVVSGVKKLGEVIWSGLKKFGSWISGLFKGEGAKTNDIRDEWMQSIGGFEGSRTLLASHGNDAQLLAAFDQAYYAGDRGTLQAGIDAFNARIVELDMAAIGAEVPGFAQGTRGQYVDFGKGTLAMLHGPEMIVPEGAGMEYSGTGGTAILQVDGRVWARMLVPALANEVSRLQLAR